jgi:hypothetical protein
MIPMKNDASLEHSDRTKEIDDRLRLREVVHGSVTSRLYKTSTRRTDDEDPGKRLQTLTRLHFASQR